MATLSSDKKPTSDKKSASAAIAWAAVAIGLGAAVGWLFLAQKLGESIGMDSVAKGVTLYYALVFGPLIVLAFGLGLMCRIRVMPVGDAPLRWGLIGLLCGAAGFLATLGYSVLNGGFVPGEGTPTTAGLITLGVGLTLFQVAAEELLFRGWLQAVLIERTGLIAGVILTAVLFSAFHILGGVRGSISLVTLMLGGLWFGLLAWRSGGLIAPIMAHFAWNAIEDLGFGLVPNPGVGPLGAVSDHDLIGATIWGATEEGLNASVGTVIVLVALILPLLRLGAARVAAARS